MAAKTFRCKVVTPKEKLMDADAIYASIPAWDGLFGVLPGRAPIVANLGTGELRVDFPGQDGSEGGSRSFYVDGGVCQMGREELTIIAEHAVPAERLTVSDVEAELREAEARQVPGDLDMEARRVQAEHLRQNRRSAEVKLRIARQHAGRAI